MRSILFYEHEHARNIVYTYVVHFPGDCVHDADVVGQAGQLRRVPKTGQPHQDVAVVTAYERGVDAQMPPDAFRRPASGERPPWLVHLLEVEVSEVGLQQLVHVVAKLHVEVALEHRLSYRVSRT